MTLGADEDRARVCEGATPDSRSTKSRLSSASTTWLRTSSVTRYRPKTMAPPSPTTAAVSARTKSHADPKRSRRSQRNHGGGATASPKSINMGVNTASMSTASSTSDKQPCSAPLNRCVSSCRRCADPSMADSSPAADQSAR